jgi:hypothetical protein
MHLLQLPDDPALIQELESSVIGHLKRLRENMEAIDQRNEDQYSDDDLILFVNLHKRYATTEKLWNHLKLNLRSKFSHLLYTPLEPFF